ncbi:hypothetical protein [Kitasatospora camelliae]|uniref:Uncharacterized protein n=1 Tax=Kitasatospora camelliae TaxID=3156397 RepID=A0AAU8K833_9ACTN
MSDDRATLGPLTPLDDRWAMGNPRPDGSWLEFRTDGLYLHAGAAEGELTPWPRITDVNGLTLGSKNPFPGDYSPMAFLNALPGPWKGHGHGYLHLTLRHPYEDIAARFDLHPRLYGGTDLALLQELLAQINTTREPHRLGDTAWLTRAVTHLREHRSITTRGIQRAVTEALAL